MKLTTKKLKQLIKEELNNVLGEEYVKPDPVKDLYNSLVRAEDESSLQHMLFRLRNITSYDLSGAVGAHSRIKMQAEKVMKVVDHLPSQDNNTNNQYAAQDIKASLEQVISSVS